ncbi:TRAP transporter small permease subunit [Rhodalgimonas zhirmunskyi]|uniref:TRAP transporter small permease protein n=1 Tax=Rhodalgimonas zhirmunskyi TaxID=2964767 RepID=A0AAJ1UDX1_9RHOB|nr:TRAP transporter small permease [Rhodoalgimonas zhirmunskyi]MDQ2094541.1 TRAP transporter small permease [Rhodoalgimonas zhirmunskyi]
MSRLIQLNNALSRFTALAAALAVIAMMLLVALDAFLRQTLNIRVPFVSVTVANYFMVMIAFLPLALAETEDRHISIDLLFSNLSVGLKRWISLIVHLLCALTCAGLTWTMWDEAMRRFSSGSVAVEDGASMAIWPGYFLLPLGFFLLTLTYLLRVALGLVGAAEAQQPLIPDTDPANPEVTQ